MKRISFVCTALTVALSVPAMADTLFVNAPSTLYPHESVASVQNPSIGFPYFDQFTLTGASQITSLGWSFIIQDGVESPLGFKISLYSDVPTGNTYSNYPGSLLYSTYISAANDDEDAPFSTNFFLDPFHVYYIASFDGAVSYHAPAGGTYWISIVADSPRLTEGYGWQHSDTCCLNQGRTYDPDFHAYFPNDDVAFQVNGTADPMAPPTMTTAATPEPSSLILAGTGILSMACAIKRRSGRSGICR